jgi:hypothetical protein
MDDAVLVGVFIALAAACAVCIWGAYRQHRRGGPRPS